MFLLSHSWKSSVRSILRGRELGANIFLGVILAIPALNFLGLGLTLCSILQQEYFASAA